MTATEKTTSPVRFVGTAPHWTCATCNRCGQDIVYQKGNAMLAVGDGYPVCLECADAIENPSHISETELDRIFDDYKVIGRERVVEYSGWSDGRIVTLITESEYNRNSGSAPSGEVLTVLFEEGESVRISLHADTPAGHPLRGLWGLLFALTQTESKEIF